jgi:hypothetical protein
MIICDCGTAVKTSAALVLDVVFVATARLLSLWVASAVSQVAMLADWITVIICDCGTALKTSAAAALDAVSDIAHQKASFAVSTVADTVVSAKLRLDEIVATLSSHAASGRHFVSTASPSLDVCSTTLVVSAAILLVLGGVLLFSCRRAAAFNHQDAPRRQASSVRSSGQGRRNRRRTRARFTKASKSPANPASRPSRRHVVFIFMACSVSAGVVCWGVSSRPVTTVLFPSHVPVEQSFDGEVSPTLQPSRVDEFPHDATTDGSKQVLSIKASETRVDSFVRSYNDMVQRVVVAVGQYPVVSNRFPNLDALESTMRIDESTSASLNSYFFQRAVKTVAEPQPASLPELHVFDSSSQSSIKDLLQRLIMPSDLVEENASVSSVPLPGRDFYDSFSLSSIKDMIQRTLKLAEPDTAHVIHPPASLPGLDGYGSFSLSTVSDWIQRILKPADPPQGRVDHAPAPLHRGDGHASFAVSSIKDWIHRVLMSLEPLEARVDHPPPVPLPGHGGSSTYVMDSIKDVVHRALTLSQPPEASVPVPPAPLPGQEGYVPFSLSDIEDLIRRTFATISDPFGAGSDQPRGHSVSSSQDHGAATRKNQSQPFRTAIVSYTFPSFSITGRSSSSSSKSPTPRKTTSNIGWTTRAKRRGISAARSALLWLEQLDSY